MGQCIKCGILMRNKETPRCYRYGTYPTTAELNRERDCPYFIEPQYDAGEPMPPEELVLIKEQDMKMRKMQCPI